MGTGDYFTSWAESHELTSIQFWWKNGECRLHDRTYAKALAIAIDLGYTEPKWYKPWTWGNGVITVG